MKKARLLLSGILLTAMAGSAYGQFSAGATIGVQVPLGDFGSSYHAGPGLNLTGRYAPTDNIRVGLNIGFNRYSDEWSGDWPVWMIPVTGLFEYHFGSKAVRPYVGGDIGIYRVQDDSYSETHVGFAPVAGVSFRASDIVSFLANLKYHYVAADYAFSWVGINVGASFEF